MLRGLLIFSISILLSQSGWATHIIGGNIILEHIQDNDYRLGLKVFVDCENGTKAALYEENGLYVGMYSRFSDQLIDSFQLFLKEGRDDPVDIVRKECVEEVDFCMIVAFYYETVTLSPTKYNDPAGYYFSWERCCRNKVVSNIIDSETNGIAFYAEVPGFAVKNSLPRFDNLPLSLLCVGNFFAYNFKVIDDDGDSLVISLTEPLKGNLDQGRPNSNGSTGWPILIPKPYPKVDWSADFGLDNVMNGRPSLTIDSETGVASVTPTQQGVFVFAIKVEEFRKGVRLGEVIRELQYTVSTCSENESPTADVSFQDSIFRVYPGKEFNINFTVADGDGDSVFAQPIGPMFRTELVGSPKALFRTVRGQGMLDVSISWSPTCDQVRGEPYSASINIKDNGCPLPSQKLVDFKVLVENPPVFEAPDIFCVERLSEDSLQVRLAFKEYGGHFAGIVLERNDGTGWDTIDTITSAQQKTYHDFAERNAQKEFCYRAYAINICGVKGDVTDSFCSVRDIDVPPLVSEISHLTVNDDEFIQLEWQSNRAIDFGTYELYRSRGMEDSILVKIMDRATDTFFIDSFVDADSFVYSYRLQVVDDCDDRSGASDGAENILLDGTVLPFVDSLYWNGFDVWEVGEYELSGISEPNLSKANESFLPSTQYFAHELDHLDDGLWSYRLNAIQKDGRLVSSSNTLDLAQKPIIWVPNAFTPNLDDKNELWDISVDFVSDYFLQVFNRWGQLIFESTDPSLVWDGKEANEGVYLYKLSYQNLKGKINFQSGSIHVFR